MDKQDITELMQRDILSCIDSFLDECFWREVLSNVDHKNVNNMKKEISQIIVRRLNELN